MTKRVYIETWGCQMNLHQSEGMAGVLRKAGYEMVDRLDRADVVLFNGCMVRQKAEEKLLGRLGAVADEKRRRRVLLGVGGCFGQIHGESLLRRSSAIDFVFGSRGHAGIGTLIERAAGESGRVVGTETADAIDETPFLRSSAVTAMVTITEGCSNFCSYCIVPYARGPMRSRPPERILAEVGDAVAAGRRELLLLGQNVNAYGTDDPTCGRFAQLLRRVAAAGAERVRFTSSHPRDLSLDILEAMADDGRICRHLHLACQSGSDRILAAMNRGYDRSAYLTLVEASRRIVPGVNLTTDLIVGFPGEGDAEFEDTVRLLEEVRFGSVYAAKYSPRPLTRAAESVDDVPRSVKEERLERVLEVQRRIALEENRKLVGREVLVLIEGETRDGAHYGRADDHRTVVVHGAVEVGDVTSVRVDGASASALLGSARVPEGAMP